METRALSIPGSWEFTPKQWPDGRGIFLEWFKADLVAEAVGHRFCLAQANHSVSAKGSLRGVHYADVPPSQAKYVYCPSGAILDVVIDIRVGSPMFGQHEAVRLDDVDRRGVYLSEGLGHAFFALTDRAAVTYLVSEPYAPTREHAINPLDPELALPWPVDVERTLSAKDQAAPSFADALAGGALPSYADCLSYYETLRTTGQ